MTASLAQPSASKSTHLNDPVILPFLAPSFSATSYLNTALPSPPLKTPQSTQQLSLSAITSQTQSHISTLSAQTSRLSATLTALTDEILRCSSRLTYEIEVLRGDANGLVEALSERGVLNSAINTFIPGGLATNNTINGNGSSESPSTPSPSDQNQEPHSPSPLPMSTIQPKPLPTNSENDQPINKLRTLLTVRSSLTAITKIFSLALSWPMPPSLLSSTTSSLISISSPSSAQNVEEEERKGQAALSRIRSEVEELLNAGDTEKAREKVAELRKCVDVWRGTSEEKARGKWVGELEGWVEDVVRKKGLVGQKLQSNEGSDKGDVVEKKTLGDRRNVGGRDKGVVEAPARTGSGAGFLRRLRDEIYMDP
ncbi:MAG: hypothetical protein Q9209_007195 [Squamulea sp. 1 TL-2023]